ncbi:MAG: ImmA/IrrE family metallo-endopeptidase [Nocardioidaceae bacterium]|nr:ImmA/IrrE family metallo-endopeptidase [Nocardioidaceae bacterium]
MNQSTSPSILKRLRSLIPARDCTFGEALVVAERQATRVAELLVEDHSDGIRWHHIDGLPRVRVVFETDLPVSGMSHWTGTEWLIAIASHDAPARQRFTLLHEFKHIIDHGSVQRLYRTNRSKSAQEQAELAADYFAGCALVSKRELKSAWGNGLQRPSLLASHFHVSEQAIRVRLAQTGLDTDVDRLPAPRCARPIRGPRSRPQRFRYARNGLNRRSYA